MLRRRRAASAASPARRLTKRIGVAGPPMMLRRRIHRAPRHLSWGFHAAYRRTALPSDSRTDQCPRPGSAGDRFSDDGPSRPRIRGARQDVLEGMKRVFRTRANVVIYPASGTGAWEAALVNTLSARRPRADVRDRPLRHAVAEDGDAPRPGARVPRPATGARGADPAGDRAAPARGPRAPPSRPSAWCTTKRRPASFRGSPRCARRSTPHGIPRCSWSTRSPRSPRSTTGTTNGASTSRSAARRRG